jgi:ABC-type phosphate transport system substrate-binding protein
MGGVQSVFAALVLLAGESRADVLVVVREDSPITTLTQRQVIDLYMGRSRTVPPDYPVRPLDLESGHALRQQFYTALTGRGEAQVDAYWAQLVFAGRVAPLTRVDDPEEVLADVQQDPHALGYLGLDDAPPGTRAVFRLETAP